MIDSGLARARWIALLVPLALLAGALGSEFLGGLYPCEMCHWQRWPHYAAVPLAAAAFFIQHRFTRALLVFLAAALVAVSGAIGLFHAGVEYGWWPGITGCSTLVSGDLSGDQLLDAINRAPMVRCDAPQWTLAGISLAGFNAIISLAAAAIIFVLMGRRRRV